MVSRPADTAPTDPPPLNLFCSPDGEVWRVHARPTGLPRYLRSFFDLNCEAYPVSLDFDDLVRHMRAEGAPYEKRNARTGGVELTAHGAAANELALWLSTALASGVRAQQG